MLLGKTGNPVRKQVAYFIVLNTTLCRSLTHYFPQQAFRGHTDGRARPRCLPLIRPMGRRDGNECNRTGNNILPTKPRIVGGTVADKHEFPWVVSLQVYFPHLEEYAHICGASVIDEWWIMTAAHCVYFSFDLEFKIVAGEHEFSVVEDEEQHRKVGTIVINPEFDECSLANDVALLKLPEKLKLDGKTVAAINLPAPQTNSTGDCVVTGWGTVNEEEFDSSDVLRKVTLPIIPDEECGESYDYFGMTIFDSMICAGYEEGGKDSCWAKHRSNTDPGDSGGSLVCQGENNEIYAAGVVSWGFGCARPEYPGVYTEVSYFVDWINEVRNQK
ncbi:hypothetical protein O3P69_003872 [Scylla paramamosain]|uniref:Peptidase S1 domain-containing protein n=1 Tax=Scylla paramamosain TaxID=85552 RepID=A0AAW0UF99_SCYPA